MATAAWRDARPAAAGDISGEPLIAPPFVAGREGSSASVRMRLPPRSPLRLLAHFGRHGLEPCDALLGRRMGREETAEPAAMQGIDDEHVRRRGMGFGFDIVDALDSRG